MGAAGTKATLVKALQVERKLNNSTCLPNSSLAFGNVADRYRRNLVSEAPLRLISIHFCGAMMEQI